MADEKRTKIGQTGPVRATSGTPAPTSASPTPAPASPTPAPAAPTSILPDHGAGAGFSTSYLPNQTDPLLGATMAGRYHIEKKLGEGGMGAVYLATHNLLEKKVALKVLHGEFARKPDLVERFMQEAKSASRIRHENVIDISDFGTTPEGLVFFAMELLKGHDLHEEVARARLAGQLLPWARSKKIFLQICSALTAAHAQGIVHRDLKPENVFLVDFLGEPDFVKLLDFGIAKLTEADDGGRKLTKTGMLFGTPEYMSPEQARGEQVDHRVDVYAMGCILFQLVTGRVPFEADNFMGVLSLHLTEPPPQIPPEVFDRIGAPRELAGVIERALLKDRNQRWGTIDELAHAIRRVCGDPLPSASQTMPTAPLTGVQSGVQAPANTTQSRQRTQWTGNLQVPQEDARPRQKSKLPIILGALIVLGGGGTAAFFAMRGGGGGGSTTSGSDVASGGSAGSAGSAHVVAGSGGSAGSAGSAGSGGSAGSATVQAPPPDAGVVDLSPLPARVTLKIDSKPRGADVKNTVTGSTYGKTPVTLDVKGSRDTLSFQLTLKGYGDAIVELTPDQNTTYTAPLEKGTSGSAPVKQVVVKNPPNTGSGGAVTRPDTGSGAKPPNTGSASKPPETGSGTKPPPPGDDDCTELPCAPKKFVPGLNGGSGSGG